MYRAVALAGLRLGIDWSEPDDLADLAARLDLRVSGERIFLDGQDVTEAVRTSEVTAVTRYAADNPRVRELLVALQRQVAADQDIVTEGRDQGTVVFPRAECKVFLTAGAEERARRRLQDLHAQGEPVELQQVLAAQERRDREDSTRAVGPLVRAPDAIDVSTDGLTPEQVVDRLASLVRHQSPIPNP
jgi:CMP/dCMP kinase